jgi:hypothetical protein
MDVLETNQLTETQALNHWYYRTKFNLLKREIGRMQLSGNKVLMDMGSGLGLFLTFLERDGVYKPDQMFGVDIAYDSPQTAIGGNALIFPDWEEGKSVNVITLMDVLEHIEDDFGFLTGIVERVDYGTVLFITVPAFNGLWSHHDVLLKHFRRYNRKSLNRLISSVPELKIERCYYAYASIFPLVFLYRKIEKLFCRRAPVKTHLRPTQAFVNEILAGMLKLENVLAPYNRLAGVAVVAVCRKVR